jgi:branched-chain amino acid transport system ATP-binding protein
MLGLEKINTYYGKSHVLFDVSLFIRQGEIVGLLGRNGVGKTTTLRTIIGLTPPANGSILFKGQEIAGRKPYQIASSGIGFVPEERCIFPNLTVDQNLIMGIKPGHYRKSNQNGWTIDQCYDHFPILKGKSQRKGGVLSGGEMQILTIARTLMGNPELIMIDEPTEGLSPIMVAEVGKIIREIHEAGKTILLVEQKLPLVLGLAQRVYVMSKGQIQWEGTPGALRMETAVCKQYLEV